MYKVHTPMSSIGNGIPAKRSWVRMQLLNFPIKPYIRGSRHSKVLSRDLNRFLFSNSSRYKTPLSCSESRSVRRIRAYFSNMERYIVSGHESLRKLCMRSCMERICRNSIRFVSISWKENFPGCLSAQRILPIFKSQWRMPAQWMW